MPSNNFTASLASTLLVEVSWLAAYMAAECGISILGTACASSAPPFYTFPELQQA
jgi:hypothetical protein